MTKFFKGTAALILVAAMSVMAGGVSADTAKEADSTMMVDLLTERAVIRALFDAPQLVGQTILVGCVDGIITLSGNVQNHTDVALAERVVLGVEGVTRVQNNLFTR